MSQPFTPSRSTARGLLTAGVIRELDHEQTRRDTACGMDPIEIAVDREDELQERRDRLADYTPSSEQDWAA